MDIMGKMKAQQQEKTEALKEAKEAAEAKASEYAALSARVDSLERTIGSLENTIADMTEALQGITPQKIEQFQQAGVKVFDPLKDTAEELAQDIKEAGQDAILSIKAAGDTGINWKGRIVSAFFIALFFLIGQFAIQYHFTPDIDYARRMMWNLQIHQDNPNLMIDFFDNEKDFEKKIENEKTYRANEELKKANQQGQDQQKK